MKAKISILFFLVLAVFITVPGELNAQKKLSKKERKELKKQQQKVMHDSLIAMLQERNFVLQATTIQSRRGNSMFVNPNINFVALVEDKGVIQTGSNSGTVGFNGLGGITLDGSVSDFEIIDKGPGKQTTVRMTVFGNGSYTVTLQLLDNGRGSARISGNRGGYITLRGELTQIENTDFYVGQSRF